MLYHQLEQEKWDSIKAYVDTCVIPCSSITGAEAVWDWKQKISHLEYAKRWLEAAYSGRLLIAPDVLYLDGAYETVVKVTSNLKNQGFRFVVLLSDSTWTALPKGVDELLYFPSGSFSDEHKKQIQGKVITLWQKARGDEAWNTD